MYTEIALWTLGCYGYYKYKTRQEREIIKKWNKLMVGANIKNNEDEKRTYKIKKIQKENYGYYCLVSIPSGLSFKKLYDLKEVIDDNLKCICELSKDKFNNHIHMKLIINPLNNLKFTPFKTNPYELFLGYNFIGEPVLLNQNKFPHLLIAGTTGTGKSRLVFIILTNLIHNHSNKEIEIYLTQVRKRDLKHFIHCKQVKFYASTMEQTRIMFNRLCTLISRREETIYKSHCDNIEEYNKISRQKMKYIYICVEEFSFYMPDSSDNKEEKKIKEKCLSFLKNIILTGRAVGVFVIAAVQKTTVDNIPSTIKSQMTRVSFRQMSDVNSINAIETTDAVGLENQEAILFTDKHIKFKTVNIDKNIIKNNIKDSIEHSSVNKIPIEKNENIKINKPMQINVPQKTIAKNKRGIISLEDVKNANSKR